MRIRARGFTLLELLVALTVFAIMGVMAYRGFTESSQLAEASRVRLDRLKQLQLGVRTMVTDLQQLAPRPIREPIGDGYRPALYRDPNAGTLLELSRAGWANTARLPRGTVQRVAYVLEDRQLKRQHWVVTDPTLGAEPVERVLLDNVESVEFRYLDASRQWVNQWPPPGAPGDLGFRLRPRAIEVTLELQDYGRIKRLVEVPG